MTAVEVGGKPLDAGRAYTIAVSAYVLGGGDGYDFKGAETLVKPEDGPVEPDVVMEAIKKAGTISPQVEGRIKPAQPANRTSSINNQTPRNEENAERAAAMVPSMTSSVCARLTKAHSNWEGAR